MVRVAAPGPVTVGWSGHQAQTVTGWRRGVMITSPHGEGRTTKREGYIMADRNLLVVFTKPVEGMEDEYHRWYDTQHLYDVVQVPGVVSAQRYQMAHPGPEGGLATDRYVAIYEIDGPPDAVMDTISARFSTDAMPGSDALDLAATEMAVWAPRGPKLHAAG